MMKCSGINIWLFVEHAGREIKNSLYMIEPPTDVADYEEKQIDSDGFMIDSIISPVLTVNKKDKLLLKHSAMARLGSRIYFFGGVNYYDWDPKKLRIISHVQRLSVVFFDIDHPELGLLPAPSLNAPKQTPCVFSARGMIYALGSSLRGCDCINSSGGGVGSGIFERYDPKAQEWQVLPDPPLPFGQRKGRAIWCDFATLVRDRYVFVGNRAAMLYLMFDLDTQKWDPPLPESIFPYGSLCVDDSLYYLTGFGTWKYGTDSEPGSMDDDDDDIIQILKRGPLFLEGEDPSRLLDNKPCLPLKNKQVMTSLDHIPLLDHMNFYEWRDLFHLGGRFFCSVATAPLVNHADNTRSQPYCRGVWIYVFEEVELPTSKSTHFRTLASFSYKIRTPFYNTGLFARCCAFGSVPDSWVKEPLKKKQVAKERKTVKSEQIQPIQPAHGGGSEGQGAFAVSARDEIMRLKAELAEKDALLETLIMEQKNRIFEQDYKINQVAKTVMEKT